MKEGEEDDNAIATTAVLGFIQLWYVDGQTIS